MLVIFGIVVVFVCCFRL